VVLSNVDVIARSLAIDLAYMQNTYVVYTQPSRNLKCGWSLFP